MRLKSVRVYGFKTFADRTEFDLHGGIVAVVGPNGCGKSNLVDAILWGLGEGTPRQLRAQSSQDVIFAGSARRKPVGYAEVTLLFDNEDGALPIETPEVAVSRKLNRAGESEYRINRSACRLRDVLELLADSGLGRAGYSIVGQKEIDQALAASPEDRRAWVDEAAGVQRYRARKIESARRLGQAQTHLERVTDLLFEIDSQREPLREEAEVAIRYKEILSSLRQVESDLLIVEVAKAVRDLQEAEARQRSAHEISTRESELAESAEEEARTIGTTIRDLDRKLEVDRHAHQVEALALERADAAVRLGEQKLAALEELELNLEGDPATTTNQTPEAQAELDRVKAELVDDEAKLEVVVAACTGARDEALVLTEALRVVEERLATARELHGQRLRREAEAAHAQERSKAIRRELKGIETTMPDLERGVQDAEATVQEIKSRLAELEASAAEIADRLQASHADDRRDDEVTRKWLADQSALEGRRQGLLMTIEAHEGLNQGARAVLEAAKQGMLPERYLPVGEAISTSHDYALAIETALGNSTNDLICPHPDDAKAAIALLKEHRLGRATFQPIPLMRSQPPTPELKQVLMATGVIGRASDLVDCKAEHRPVIESLLGRVVIVEFLDDALNLAKTRDWSRMVSLDGDLLHSSGAVTGGQGDKAAYGLVQRKSDLAEIERKIEELEGKIRQANQRVAKRAAARTDDEHALAALAAARKEIDLEATEARDWLTQLRDELTSTQRSRQKLEAELAGLGVNQDGSTAEVDLPKLESERDEVLKRLAGRSADASSAEQQLREADDRVAQARLRVEIAEKRLAAALENERLRSKKIANLGPEKHRTSLEIERAVKERERARAAKEGLEAALSAAGAEREKLTTRQAELQDNARQARHSAQAQVEAAHQAELARARLDARRASSGQRLLEEYGISEDEALSRADQTQVPKDAAALVPKLRRDLRAMGEVNLGAVEAYQRLTERSSELIAQKDDVEQGIKEILAGIRELDKLTRDRFLTTFQAVQAAFTEIFTRIFEGGEGRIELTNPDDVLDTGLEIDVTLPGKKRQRLELLSGGERSLCATAFLFALLKVKPSPLVVLDEVDAPLDGRNVERFVQLLQDFSDTVQFIVITHNPVTIESAPIWLGVTMQEPGVSTLIPARMPQPALA